MSLYHTQVLATPATHRQSLSRIVDTAWAAFAETLTSCASGPLSRLARDQILSALQAISDGELTLVFEDRWYRFGQGSSSPRLRATIRVVREAFWTRIALFSDLGLAEGYMYGDFECDDISALIQIIIANRARIKTDSFVTAILSRGRGLTASRFLGSLSNSRANISAHYDLSNDMFAAFLSEDMCYSSAIFKDFTEDLRPEAKAIETHEDAQIRKMRKIIQQTEVHPGHRVLEIGTGWGSLAILLAQTVACTIDTITLSSEQAALARKRIAAAGLTERITVHLIDFRNARNKAEWHHAFDRFISVEMIENVGRDFIQEYWSVVDWMLKERNSAGCVQVITMPEARIPAYDAGGVDFIQKWIFPGCYIPSYEFLVTTMTKGSAGRLTIHETQNIGPHYARTLREWKQKFLLNWERTIAPALVADYELSPEALEIFRRKWMYYFDYCEAGFVTRSLGDHIITFSREEHVDFGNAVLN